MDWNSINIAKVKMIIFIFPTEGIQKNNTWLWKSVDTAKMNLNLKKKHNKSEYEFQTNFRKWKSHQIS